MGDSLEELEEQAENRRKSGKGRGSRSAGTSRHPRNGQAKKDQLEAREAELRAREEKRRQEAEAAKKKAAEEEERRRQEEEDGTSGEAGENALPPNAPPPRGARVKRARPKSIPFYPNPEHEDFLWEIKEAGVSLRKEIPATAVLRLALNRLASQMSPADIVQLLGDSVQAEGKIGRPRL